MYLRLIYGEDQIHCTLVFVKARVTLLRQISIPRLELTAVLLSVKLGAMLKRDMAYDDIRGSTTGQIARLCSDISQTTREDSMFMLQTERNKLES